MNKLLGATHNSVDGTYCWGMLQSEGSEFGSRGEICTYRCSVCGREVRNVEEEIYKSSIPQAAERISALFNW